MEKPVKTKITSPDSAYDAPHQVLRDACLSTKEKLTTLKNWESDQTALLRADDENMAAQKPVPPATELLADIQEAERIVDPTRSRR